MTDTLVAPLRNNPRLRWGLWLIAGIGWLYGVLLLADLRDDQARKIAQLRHSVQRLQAELNQPEWPARASAAAALTAQLETGLWQASTAGLAQSALQDWLGAALDKAGAQKPVVTINVIDEIRSDKVAANTPGQPGTPVTEAGEDAPTPADLWKLRATVGFPFNAPALLDFLARVERNDQALTVFTLTARKSPQPRVEIALNAYFRRQVADDAGAAPSEGASPPTPAATPNVVTPGKS